jgi:hypothetical protein
MKQLTVAEHVGGILEAKGKVEGGVAALLDILEQEIGGDYENLRRVVEEGLRDVTVEAHNCFKVMREDTAVKVEKEGE